MALAVAAAAHGLRFGDEHAFGEEYHDWISTLLVAGLPAVAWAFLALAAAGLTTFGQGSVLAERLAGLLPGRGKLPILTACFACMASAIYFGIEHLEADGDTNYALALAIIVALSFCAAIAVRRLLALVALVTLAILTCCAAALRGGERRLVVRDARPQLTPRCDWAAVRLGRAPPVPA